MILSHATVLFFSTDVVLELESSKAVSDLQLRGRRELLEGGCLVKAMTVIFDECCTAF